MTWHGIRYEYCFVNAFFWTFSYWIDNSWRREQHAWIFHIFKQVSERTHHAISLRLDNIRKKRKYGTTCLQLDLKWGWVESINDGGCVGNVGGSGGDGDGSGRVGNTAHQWYATTLNYVSNNCKLSRIHDLFQIYFRIYKLTNKWSILYHMHSCEINLS